MCLGIDHRKKNGKYAGLKGAKSKLFRLANISKKIIPKNDFFNIC